LLNSDILYNQKLNYLHWHLATAGYVNEPWHWKYSSAVDYMASDKGRLTRIFGVNDYASSSDSGATGLETCA